MSRRQDWRRRLGRYLAKVRSRPYSIGEQDCWLFVGGAISAMTGRNPSRQHRGSYKTTRGALGVMKRAGAENMADFAALHLEELASPVVAQIGDVVAIPTDDAFGYSLGIVNGERVLVVTETGVDTRDRADATRAFGV